MGRCDRFTPEHHARRGLAGPAPRGRCPLGRERRLCGDSGSALPLKSGKAPPALATTAPHATGSRVHTCATPGKRGRSPARVHEGAPGAWRAAAPRPPRRWAAAKRGTSPALARTVPAGPMDRGIPHPRAISGSGSPRTWPTAAPCSHGLLRQGAGTGHPKGAKGAALRAGADPQGSSWAPDRVAFTEGGQPHAPVVGIDRCARLTGHGPLGGEAGSDDGAAGAVRPCGPRRRTRPPGAACPPRSAPAATASRTPRPAPAAPGRRRAP